MNLASELTLYLVTTREVGAINFSLFGVRELIADPGQDRFLLFPQLSTFELLGKYITLLV